MDEADYEQPRMFWRYSAEQKKPAGLPLGPDGKPLFMITPAAYAADLGDGLKIRFLLNEVQRLDTSETRDDCARALFSSRDDLPRSLRTRHRPDLEQPRHAVRSLRPSAAESSGHDAPAKKMWELGDDEAIAIAGGRLQVITLPPQESPLALLKQIETECPKSTLVPEAIYTRALFFQSRQQFPQAIVDYQRLMSTFPTSVARQGREGADQADPTTWRGARRNRSTITGREAVAGIFQPQCG